MKKLSILSLLFLVFFSCRKDTDEIVDIKTSSNPPEIIDQYTPSTKLLTASISGFVFDENNTPLEDAIVKLRGNTYTTDDQGRFYALNIEMDGEGTFFTVEKEGYFKGSRRFFPRDGAVSSAQVQMMQLNEAGKFSAETGAVVNGPDGISLSFPANAIKKESGTLYSGEVSVAAKWLDPTASNVSDLMPGSLQGVNNELEEVALVSYGMMAVELFGENGEKLNVADDQKVELSFPVPTSIQSAAPDEIPLWFFEDEKFGVWVEDGKANLVNGKYVGEVSHFSFWNCDDPFPLVQVTGKLIISELNGAPIFNAIPMADVRVNVQVANSTLASHGFTDTDGIFSGKMPKDVEMILTFGDPALCSFASYSIGPFTADTDIGGIVLPGTNVFAINGSVVNCGGPTNNGYLEITYGSQRKNIFFQGTNTFAFGLLNCEAATEFNIVAIDIDSLTASSSENFAITGFVDVGEIVACGTPPYYFSFQLGSISSTYIQIDELEAKQNDNPLYPDGLILGFSHLPASSGVHSFIIHSNTALPVGSYNKTHLEKLNFFFNWFPYGYDVFLYNSTGGSKLESFVLTISVNEGPGGVIQGEFDAIGDVQFDSHPDSIHYDYPFSGDFRLLRE